jgi:citronellol/citronellal dehydrogenase
MMHAMARRWQGTGTRGNIVNIVATFQRGMPGVAHTCAARAAVTHLSKTVAVEWAQHGIRVNCIAPGAIASTGFRQYSPEAVKAFAGANPMKHVGDVQDVAEAAVYLSAPSGKFVTGELLTVDGGGVLWGEVWTIAKPDYFKVNT